MHKTTTAAQNATRFSALLMALNLSSPVMGGIYSNTTDHDNAQNHPHSLLGTIQPGKIILEDKKSGCWIDYASATAIANPGDFQTKTILSCAHVYLYNTPPSDSILYHYQDYQGNLCEIESIIPYISNADRLTNSTDLALYYLNEAIQGPCITKISSDFAADVTLSSLSYGWRLNYSSTMESPSLVNVYGEMPHLLSGKFQKNRASLYERAYKSDRLLKLTPEGYGSSYHYLSTDAEAQSSCSQQLYHHDSGSSWFQTDANGNYLLTALSCCSPQASYHDEKEAQSPLDSIKFDFFEDRFHLDVIRNSNSERRVVDILTPLHPHKEWIQRHIRC